MKTNNKYIDSELAKILQEEIWKEIEKESGLTREMYDQQIIDELKKITDK